jgi:hypothetical protein
LLTSGPVGLVEVHANCPDIHVKLKKKKFIEEREPKIDMPLIKYEQVPSFTHVAQIQVIFAL